MDTHQRKVPELRKDTEPSIFTEPLSGESPEELSHYLRYLTLPVPRSVAKYRRSFPEHCKDLEISFLRAMAILNAWKVRGGAYDVAVARSILCGSEECQLKRVQRIWDLAEKSAIRALETINHTTHGAASKTFFEALKQLRLETGDPTELTKTVIEDSKDYESLSRTELRNMRKIAKKLEVV